MRKVALRGLLAHKGRMLATLLAVALGVAFIAGVLILTDTMNESFDDLFATAYENTDAVVRSGQTIDTGLEGGGEQRGDIDATLLPTVQAVGTVEAAQGEVFGTVQILDSKGDPVGSQGFGPPTFGGSWSDVEALSSWRLREGKAPSAANEIVVDAAVAKEQDYSVGDTIQVQTKTGVGDYTLVGVAGFGTAESAGGATNVLFTTDQAQKVVGQPGKFSSISVKAENGVSQSEVVDDLKSAMTDDDVQVISGKKITEESQSDLKKQLSGFTIFLTAFAVIAVIVGAFVIYNSFSIVIAQRTREMALLRAIGASRRQVRRSVLIEAVATGLLGSLCGFLLGLGIAAALVGLMGIEGSLAVNPQALVIALLVGLLVTLFASLMPAWRASRVPPVAAMREVEIDTSGRSKPRFIIGLVVLASGGLLAVMGAGQADLALVGYGLALVLAGLIVSGPGLAGPVSAVVGWPLDKLRGITGSLARENAGRNPKRSAVTAYALMVGIGVMSLVLVLNASIRASIDKVLDDTFAVDFIIQADSTGTLGMPPEVATTVAALPEVQSAVPVRQAPVKIDDKATLIIGTSSDAFEMFGLKMVEGSEALGEGQIVVLDKVAKKHDLAVGSSLDAEFLNTGTTRLTVAGIYKERTQGTGLGDYVIGSDQFAQAVPGSTDSTVLIKLVDGESVDKVKPILEKAVKPFGTPKVQDMDDFKNQIGGQLDMVVNMIGVLMVLAFIIAMVGIANTIALSVFERTREMGLLRAVGMSRRQLRATIRWEAVIVALFGAALGLVLGLLGGWGLVSALRDEGFNVFRVPVTTLVILALIAGVLGLLAAMWPAWRAGRLKVLDAIHTD
ncbi:MAG TPA: FtsX-like permease family protein [Acidimicrobiales bacterium]